MPSDTESRASTSVRPIPWHRPLCERAESIRREALGTTPSGDSFHVGFVAGASQSPDSSARVNGFRDAITELDGRLDEAHLLDGDWTSAGGEPAMQLRMNSGEPLPQAVGVIYALNANGLKVPDDIVVTGFDDITLTRYFSPPLTTIRQSGSLLSEVAVDALVAILDGSKEVEQTIVIPTEFVVRGSCGCVEQPEMRGTISELPTPQREVT
jgi:DNA-binding LacI/PurR family transcriptional regulator